MYWCVTIILLSLFSVYKIFKYNLKEYNIGAYLLSLYSLLPILTLFYKSEGIIFSLEATLYFILILFLFIIPVLKFKGNELVTQSKHQLSLFTICSYFFIITGLLSIIYYTPIVFRLFSSNISLLTLRTNMVGGETYLNTTFFSIFLNFTCQFYPIILVFYFYSITFLNKSRSFNNLLLLSSTAYILNVLTAIGRDGFILWLMSYIFAYLIFNKFMSDYIRKKQKKIFSIFLILGLSFLIPITAARFFNSEKGEGINSLVKYAGGSQFSNFNNFYNRIDHPEHYGSIKNIFPIFDLTKTKNTSFLDDWENKVWALGVDTNVFSTFIGSIYLNIGRFGTLILAITAFLLGNTISRKSQTIDFSKIMLITLYSQVILHGYFYYKLAYSVSNLYMVTVIVLAMFFRKKLIIT